MLLPCTLSLLLLSSHTLPFTSAQLLFPVNVPNADGAGQIPFHSTHEHQAGGAGALWQARENGRAPRVAIIGGGAAGSSAAYFLAHFARLKGEGLATDVTLYERADYIGGRSTVVYPWEDDPERTPDGEEEEAPVECGGSIFVAANKNLHRAAEVFNLTLIEPPAEEGSMSIWDGSSFVFSESKGWGWGYWDLAKMFWRYGRSPLKVRALVKTTVASFLQLYSPAFISSGAFDSLSAFASATNLSYPSTLSAKAYFDEEGISPLFTTELIAAATAVNYGTPVGKIHGTGALVSLAATGAVAVDGGNRRLFEAFLGSSESRLRLGREGGRVVEIVKLDQVAGGRAQWVVKTASGGGTYDAVIFAAPYHQTGVSVHNSPVPSLIPRQPYVHLHVTFIITNATTPLASYFNLSDSTTMPNTIFGTFDTPSPSPPTFNSLNYLKPLPASIGARFGNDSTWHVVKMFSSYTLGESMLDDLFGRGNVGKKWEKVWASYPQLRPVESENELAPVRPDEGFYYVNGFERLISTMETETVASFNAVSLLLRDLYGYTPPRSWAEWETEEK